MSLRERILGVGRLVKRGIIYASFGAALSAAPATGCITIESGGDGSSGSSGRGGSSSLDSQLFGFWSRSNEGLYFSPSGTAYSDVEDDCDFENRWRYSTEGGMLTLDFLDGINDDDIIGTDLEHRRVEYGFRSDDVLSVWWEWSNEGFIDYTNSNLCQESDLYSE